MGQVARHFHAIGRQCEILRTRHFTISALQASMGRTSTLVANPLPVPPADEPAYYVMLAWRDGALFFADPVTILNRLLHHISLLPQLLAVRRERAD